MWELFTPEDRQGAERCIAATGRINESGPENLPLRKLHYMLLC